MKNNDININKEESKTFSVNVFLVKDKIMRFIPGIKNKFGIYVPITEGMEVSLNSSPQEIVKVYLKIVSNAVKHLCF